jgi:hypothetical protein
MSHHGSDPFDPERKAAFDKLLNSTAQFRGALGDFPEGQMNKTDEGAVQFAVGVQGGKVVLDFGTPVAWVGMNPQQAADLATLILKRAREAARATGQMVSFTIG